MTDTITIPRATVQQGLEALAIADNIALVGAAYTPKSIDRGLRKIRESATALRKALEQPEQEPVAKWIIEEDNPDSFAKHPAFQPASQPEQQAEPVADGNKVICPACCHQFRAIPTAVQTLMLNAGFEPPFVTPPASQPEQQAEPTPIYYMRDNHTFKELSADVSTALVEIESEFNAGYTYGSLFSKRKGFPWVHASGSEHRLAFFLKCKTVLEKWADAPPAAQRKMPSHMADALCEMVPRELMAQPVPPTTQRPWLSLTGAEIDANEILRYHFSLNNGPVTRAGMAVVDTVTALLKAKNHG